MIPTDNQPILEQDSQRREELRTMAVEGYGEFCTLSDAPTTASAISKKLGRERAARVMPYLGVCFGCGGDAVHRHHKDSNTFNNDRDNLIPLCRACHQLAHGV